MPVYAQKFHNNQCQEPILSVWFGVINPTRTVWHVKETQNKYIIHFLTVKSMHTQTNKNKMSKILQVYTWRIDDCCERHAENSSNRTTCDQSTCYRTWPVQTPRNQFSPVRLASEIADIVWAALGIILSSWTRKFWCMVTRRLQSAQRTEVGHLLILVRENFIK